MAEIELVPVWDPRANGPHRGYLCVDPHPAVPAVTRDVHEVRRTVGDAILDILADCPGLTQVELSAWIGRAPSHINAALFQLEREGCIRVDDHGEPRVRNQGRRRSPLTYFVVEA